jgi:hypothetical protein
MGHNPVMGYIQLGHIVVVIGVALVVFALGAAWKESR